MLSVSVFGATMIDGTSIDPGERLVSLTLFGRAELDFTAVPLSTAEVLIVSVFGNTLLKVRPDQPVRISGFSLFGSREIDPRRTLAPPSGASIDTGAEDDAHLDEDLPLEIVAYSLFGGFRVERPHSSSARLPKGDWHSS